MSEDGMTQRDENGLSSEVHEQETSAGNPSTKREGNLQMRSANPRMDSGVPDKSRTVSEPQAQGDTNDNVADPYRRSFRGEGVRKPSETLAQLNELNREDLLARLADYPEEDLRVALRAAEAQRLTRDEGLYFLHHFFEEDRMYADAQQASLTIPVTPTLMNPADMVHGGVTAYLCDNVMGMASYMSAGRPGVTLDLSVRYHLPGRSGSLTAQGEVVHAGGRINSTRCEIRDEEGNLVATATGSFYHGGPR